MQAELSSQTTIGLDCSCPNPRSIALRWMTSCPAMLAATYSASAELRVTQSWHLVFQDTGALFRESTYPVTDFRVSGSDA
eukprot:3939299-Rhodomonas_salina.1